MSGPFIPDGREGRQRMYDWHAAMLRHLGRARAKHQAEGDCDADPICIGPDLVDLMHLVRADPSFERRMLLVAVGEVGDLVEALESARLALAAEKAKVAELQARMAGRRPNPGSSGP